MILYNNKDDFDELISEGDVLVIFYMDSCAPCKMLENELESINDKIKIIRVNADKNRGLCKKYGVMSVPAMIYFNNGSEVKTKNGYMTSDDILNWLDIK